MRFVIGYFTKNKTRKNLAEFDTWGLAVSAFLQCEYVFGDSTFIWDSQTQKFLTFSAPLYFAPNLPGETNTD